MKYFVLLVYPEQVLQRAPPGRLHPQRRQQEGRQHHQQGKQQHQRNRCIVSTKFYEIR